MAAQTNFVKRFLSFGLRKYILVGAIRRQILQQRQVTERCGDAGAKNIFVEIYSFAPVLHTQILNPRYGPDLKYSILNYMYIYLPKH